MNEEAKKILEELKAMVLEYHRLAGVLDNVVEQIDLVADGGPGDYTAMYVKQQLIHMNDMKMCRGLTNLDVKEQSLWDKLIKELKKGV